WRGRDAVPTVCADIPGTTGPSYTMTSADVGSRIVAVVRATNGGGTTTASSTPSADVTFGAPANSLLPALNGTPREGVEVVATAGMWASGAPIAFAYRWQRCDAAGALCADVPGATGTAYTATETDVGASLRIVVTASSAGGSTTAVSAASTPVLPPPPVSIEAPVVIGAPQDGSVLVAAAGSWSAN